MSNASTLTVASFAAIAGRIAEKSLSWSVSEIEAISAANMPPRGTISLKKAETYAAEIRAQLDFMMKLAAGERVSR